MSLLPLPERSYTSLDKAFNDINIWAINHGYGVAKECSKPENHGKTQKFWWFCSFSCQSNFTSIQQKTTCMTGCQFCATIMHTVQGGIWKFKVVNDKHNHPATLSELALPVHCKRTEADCAEIKNLTQSNTHPQAIYNNFLSQDKKLVYNDRYKFKKESLQGRTPVQALLHEPKEYRLADSEEIQCYYYKATKDHQDHLQTLFFTHSRSIEILKGNYDTIMLDCTSKTNKFQMPLLHIIGMTCLNTSFEIAYCLLPNEQQPAYMR
jgi:hypothetical protein